MILYILTPFFLLMTSCQPMPTRLTSQTEVSAAQSAAPSREQAKEWAQRVLKSRPIIIDTRSDLDFGVSHIPGAINLNWQDFSLREDGRRGLLIEDNFALARRMALYGISPETSVLVVGNAIEGNGEEGRVAWMLKYLGVSDVSVASHKLFRSSIPRQELPPQNKPIWKPKINEDIIINYADFSAQNIRQPQMKHILKVEKHGNSQVLPSESKTDFILDVRDEQDIQNVDSNQSFEFKTKMVSISWKNFYTAEGMLNPSVQQELFKKGISQQDKLVIISHNGVKSAAATFALMSLGWKNVKNYAGGFEELQKIKTIRQNKRK